MVILVLSLSVLSLVQFWPHITAQDASSENELRLDDNLLVTWREFEFNSSNILCVAIQNTQSGSGDSYCHSYARGAIQEAQTTLGHESDPKVWVISFKRSDGGRLNTALNLTCYAMPIGNDVSVNCEFGL